MESRDIELWSWSGSCFVSGEDVVDVDFCARDEQACSWSVIVCTSFSEFHACCDCAIDSFAGLQCLAVTQRLVLTSECEI